MIEEIIFPQNDVKNIVVSYSGGVESTLLLYLLCKYYEKTDVKIIAYTISKFTADEEVAASKGWTPESVQAAKVMQYVQNLTEKQPLHIIEYWNKSQQKEIMKKYNLKKPLEAKPIIEQELGLKILETYNANVWYSGYSIFPSVINMKVILHDYDKDLIQDTIGFDQIVHTDNVEQFETYTKVRPFATLNKSDVLHLYMKLNLFHSLYKKTISCPYHYGPCFNQCQDTIKARTVAKSDCLERLYAERLNGVSQLKV